jgi:hypothetical protein
VQCMRENMLESYKQGNEWWHLFKKRAQHERVCVNWLSLGRVKHSAKHFFQSG